MQRLIWDPATLIMESFVTIANYWLSGNYYKKSSISDVAGASDFPVLMLEKCFQIMQSFLVQN